MRARSLLLLALLVAAAAPAPAAAEAADADLIVLLEDTAQAPRGLLTRLAPAAEIVLLRALHGFVLLDAPPALETALREAPGVLRVQRATPLELHGVADNLHHRLVRATPDGNGLGPDAPTGRGVTVAVIDSGIDAAHPDLAGRVARNVRVVDGEMIDAPGDVDGHGTHVAGIVAASGATGPAGVAPNARLVGIDITTRFTTASSLLAFDWILSQRDALDVDVVVNAWGRTGREPYDPDDAIARAIDRLTDAGIVVLFSASNHGPAAMSLSFEAQHPRVVTVGAVDAAARLQDYSSRGPVRAPTSDAAWVKPDVVAPGESVTSLRSTQAAALPDDSDVLHTTRSGTSQAVPHVAGIVALMLESNASLAPRDVLGALRASAIDFGAPGPDDATGFGLVDARDAIRQARGLGNDRGNTLVAGGVERYEAARDAAKAPASLARTLLRAEVEWSATIPVKPGARLLAFDAAITDARRVVVERDGVAVGTWTAGAFDDARLRGRLDAPEPGMYTLRVLSPAHAQARMGIDVFLSANATRALELDSRYRAPDVRGAPTDDALGPLAPLLSQAARGWPLLVVGAVLAVALRRPPPPPRTRRRIELLPY